jgi:hypothetical protein
MNPIRRELLNGVFVLVLASLMSAAFAAFQVSFNLQLWILILIGAGVAVGFYVVFDLTLRYVASTEAREEASEESTRQREEQWLKRVGTPVRFELHAAEGLGTGGAVIETLKAMRPGSDLTFLIWVSRRRQGNSIDRGGSRTSLKFSQGIGKTRYDPRVQTNPVFRPQRARKRSRTEVGHSPCRGRAGNHRQGIG